MARMIGALVGVAAFVVAMNVYLLAPLHHSFRTAWIPYVVAWAVYRLAWARFSVLRRCPSGCGARIYYRVDACPHCLAPVRERRRRMGRRILLSEVRAARVGRFSRG
jgi:hypothetical protein